MESLDGLDFLTIRGLSLANGLGGRLLPLLSPLGGCGNELMLTAFLSVLGVAGIAWENPLGWARADSGEGLGGGGRCEVDGALRLLGVPGMDLVEIAEGMFPVLFLDLARGNAGSAIFGGPFDRPAGRGSVVVMLNRAGSAAGDCARCPISEVSSCKKKPPLSIARYVHERLCVFLYSLGDPSQWGFW